MMCMRSILFARWFSRFCKRLRNFGSVMPVQSSPAARTSFCWRILSQHIRAIVGANAGLMASIVGSERSSVVFLFIANVRVRLIVEQKSTCSYHYISFGVKAGVMRLADSGTCIAAVCLQPDIIVHTFAAPRPWRPKSKSPWRLHGCSMKQYKVGRM